MVVQHVITSNNQGSTLCLYWTHQEILKWVCRFYFLIKLKCTAIVFETFSYRIRSHVRFLLIIHVVGISLMNPVIVHSQVPPVGKSLPTLCASERSLPHVNVPLVGSQVPAAGKTFTTLSTAKRPLPCVCAGVHSELRGSEEALVTELAGVKSDSGVA